ncbi:MAG TPA: 5'/3'-nucleotidase SurE [Opitutaceae bacterium]|nr:5'/3'-nucleotidase SurE [Opitutaceae bacterium]
MRILVTNDDGIDSVFLHELIRALSAAGHSLSIAAPLREQSWIGAAKSRTRPVSSCAVDHGFGCVSWVIDGTPSDCVNIALAHLLPERPDAVVSGINIGLNASLGFILASGTIGGAWEGALHGLPAFAFSQDLTFEAYDAIKQAGGIPDESMHRTLRASAAHAARITGELAGPGAESAFVVHNINFPLPCTGSCTTVRTVPAQVKVPELFSPSADDGTHRFVFKLGDDVSPLEPLTDRAALASGRISHTVLDYRALGRA